MSEFDICLSFNWKRNKMLKTAKISDKFETSGENALDYEKSQGTAFGSGEVFRAVFENATDGILLAYANSRKLLLGNAEICRTLGYTLEEIKTLSLTDIHPEVDLSCTGEYFNPREKKDRENFPVKHKDGSILYADITFACLEINGKSYWAEFLKNITHEIKSEEKSNGNGERLCKFFDDLPALVCEFIPDSTLTFVNKAFSEYFKASSEELTGQSFLNFIPQNERDVLKKQYTSLTPQKPISVGTNKAMLNGKTRWLEWRKRAIFDQQGQVLKYQVVGVDITERKLAEEKIHFFATTDSLTGIFNRREFTRLLENEMERAQRYGTPLSLVMYDLDSFKWVNDTFGHDAGDDVLRSVTDLVMENIRSVDLAGRWGGDEFLVLMPQSDLSAAMSVAEKLRQTIAGHSFVKIDGITASFGVTMFVPQDDSNSLLKRVDDALYQAKKNGRNRIEMLIE
jgi:diguanylate cyclase (GGDEF)-like protein/PAS domain S-box-containing protein